jgi:hypothetical protein
VPDIIPTRREPRGDFPTHDDARAALRRVRTAEDAALIARLRLLLWRARHGQR